MRRTTQLSAGGVKRAKMQQGYAIAAERAAPTEGELGNVLNKFFAGVSINGDATGPESNVDQTHQTRYTDPSFMQDLGQIVMHMTARNLDFVAKFIFPTTFTDDLSYSSTVLEYNAAYMVATPTFGTSRTFTNRVENKISKAMRYGANFIMESDQFDTPQGQKDFMRQMRQLVEIIKTNYEMVGWANLMLQHDYKHRFVVSMLSTKFEFVQALRQQKMEFAEPYKSISGLRTLAQDASMILKIRTGQSALYAIMPEEKMALLTDAESNRYSRIGQAGADAQLGDGEIKELAKMALFTAPIMANEIIGGMLTPLNTVDRVGHYHVMANRHRHKVKAPEFEYLYEDYGVNFLFNMNTNSFEKISWVACNENDGRWMGQETGGVHLLNRDPYHSIAANDTDLFYDPMRNDPTLLNKLRQRRVAGAGDILLEDVAPYLDHLFIKGFYAHFTRLIKKLDAAYAAVQGDRALDDKLATVEDRDMAGSYFQALIKSQPNEAGCDFYEWNWNSASAAAFNPVLAGGAPALASNQAILNLAEPDFMQRFMDASRAANANPRAAAAKIPIAVLGKIIQLGKIDLNKLVYTRELVSMAILENVPPPVTYMLAKPFDAYRMQSMVFTAADAGFTYTSIPKFRADFTAANGSQSYHATVHVGVHVNDEKRILIRNNTFYDGYVSGMNNTMINQDEAEINKQHGFDTTNRDDPARPSIYVMSMPYDTLDRKLLNDEYVDITGKSHIEQEQERAHYPSAAFYGHAYGFRNISDPYNFGVTTSAICRVLHLANAWYMDHAGTKLIEQKGQGVHGISDEGAADVRNTGKYRYKVNTY